MANAMLPAIKDGGIIVFFSNVRLIKIPRAIKTTANNSAPVIWGITSATAKTINTLSFKIIKILKNLNPAKIALRLFTINRCLYPLTNCAINILPIFKCAF